MGLRLSHKIGRTHYNFHIKARESLNYRPFFPGFLFFYNRAGICYSVYDAPDRLCNHRGGGISSFYRYSILYRSPTYSKPPSALIHSISTHMILLLHSVTQPD
jgi:hypothetical protein